ncbi:MAG: hypothetical protein GY705_20455 [Bacteroidetes bacterium]|nr:hypothetical protein [Bacteroidota bacterium]
MIQYTLHDAYTSISPFDKSKLIRFFLNNIEGAKEEHILRAIEYAVKDFPSDGGFIYTASHKNDIEAAILVNRTGMEGYFPKHLLAFVAMSDSYIQTGKAEKLLQIAIDKAENDIAIHVEPKSSLLEVFHSVGLRAKYFEMRLDKVAGEPAPLHATKSQIPLHRRNYVESKKKELIVMDVGKKNHRVS